MVGIDRSHQGLRVGDVVLEANGKKVLTVDELRVALSGDRRDALLLRVRRGDREIFVGIER